MHNHYWVLVDSWDEYLSCGDRYACRDTECWDELEHILSSNGKRPEPTVWFFESNAGGRSIALPEHMSNLKDS